jgi:hypothetical protein
MLGHRYFHQLDGKTYFKRSSHGPYYQIGLNEDLALRGLVAWQRRRMTLVVVVFAAALVPAAFGFSSLLDLEAGLGFVAAAVLIALGVAPFALMLAIHLTFQRRVRDVLGERHGEMDIGLAEGGPVEPDSGGEGKLAVLLFIGVAWLTLSAYMLVFSPGEMPFRKTLVWVLNLGASGLLTFLGGYGLATLGRGRANGTKGRRKAPTPEYSRDASGDRR